MGASGLNQSVYTANCEPNTVIMHPLALEIPAKGLRELDIGSQRQSRIWPFFARVIMGCWSGWPCLPSFWTSPIRWSSTPRLSIGIRSGGFDRIPTRATVRRTWRFSNVVNTVFAATFHWKR